MREAVTLAFGVVLSFATTALADPCKAIPDKGPMPAHLKPGSTFSGPVTYVGDGDSLCVAVGPSQADWVEVRVSDFYAPELHEPGGQEAKAALERIARGREVECVARHRSYDRVVAVCTLQGSSLGDRMRAAGVVTGGRGRNNN
jgi:micrococcal nuclease